MIRANLEKSNYWRRAVMAIALVSLVITVFLLVGGVRTSAETPKNDQGPIVIVVDKKTNKLHLTRNNDGVLTPFKSFNATLGMSLGDKMVEGDLKTPEGIYDFLFRSLPSTGLKPMFGVMAIYISYPNLIDKIGHKTGFDILLHGTDNPERLNNKYDSKGCVVLANNEVEEVWPNITLKNTRVVITRDFEEIANAPRREKLKEFFDAWLKAWSEKRLDDYIDSYADEFIYDKMNRIDFRTYKEKLNKAYETITVKAGNRQYYFHEKYDVITFDQTYESTLAGGKPGFSLHGRKNLYVQMRNGHYKIIAEELVK